MQEEEEDRDQGEATSLVGWFWGFGPQPAVLRDYSWFRCSGNHMRCLGLNRSQLCAREMPSHCAVSLWLGQGQIFLLRSKEEG